MRAEVDRGPDGEWKPKYWIELNEEEATQLAGWINEIGIPGGEEGALQMEFLNCLPPYADDGYDEKYRRVLRHIHPRV